LLAQKYWIGILLRTLLVLQLALIFAVQAKAQNAIKLTKITSPITLDGVIDEAAWQNITPFTMVQYEPVFMGEMQEKTDVRVAYDDEYFYAAGKMYTKDASTIAANSLYRDRYSSDDVFAIILDPFNDNQNGLRFFTTPAGVRFDQSISNDANSIAGSNAVNGSWNTYWDVVTTETDEGWFAEIRIPLSSIGFQSSDGVAEMGLIVYRWLAYHNERYIFPAIPPNWDQGNIKPSQAQDIILTGVESKKPIYFTPYAVTGFTRENQLNSTNTEYNYKDDTAAEIGFDLKYNVTSNLTLDVTANTDFAQVEADDQQLNLTRFSLSFDEKRQFFQQRSGLFDFSFGNTKLFYSRKVGLDNSGNPVRIYGGARLTGRVGDLDVGFINMQTASNANLNSENFSVLRLKKKVVNSNSYVGGLLTSRLDAEGNTNLVLGIDTDFNIFGDDYIETKVSQTMDNRVPDERRWGIDNNSIFRITWQRRASVGLYYRFFVNRTGADFEPGIGFYRTKNTSDYYYSLGYGILAPSNSVFKKNTFQVSSYNISENESFDLRSRFIGAQWDGEFKSAGKVGAEIKLNQEHLLPNEAFKLVGQIYIPVDNYAFVESIFSYETPENKSLKSKFSLEYGDIFDGKRTQVKVEPKWIANIHFELSGSYQITKLDFPSIAGRDVEKFTAHLAQLRGQYALNKKLSASLFVQYSNISELAGANFRFRYNFSEGRDFWVVLNEQQYTNRDPLQFGYPRLPNVQSRSVLIKYTHTFTY
tara:strand:- start:5634 stop:7901 length:2268 start_codon:yes stop_codon:yes gene_type:complete